MMFVPVRYCCYCCRGERLHLWTKPILRAHNHNHTVSAHPHTRTHPHTHTLLFVQGRKIKFADESHHASEKKKPISRTQYSDNLHYSYLHGAPRTFSFTQLRQLCWIRLTTFSALSIAHTLNHLPTLVPPTHPPTHARVCGPAGLVEFKSKNHCCVLS